MKKYTFTFVNLVITLIFAIAACSQTRQESKGITNSKEIVEKSRFETFSLKTGSLIEKEFVNPGKAKRVEV